MFTQPLRRGYELKCSLVLERQSPQFLDPTSLAAARELEDPEAARVLVVCDDDTLWVRLERALQQEGFSSECVKSVTEGCASARSGQFQVIFTTPVLHDGSWMRLVDLAHHTDNPFVIVVVATNFDLRQWVQALEDGAFDVLDALHELEKTGETARRALWAAYLKGAARLDSEQVLPPWAA